MDHKHIPAFVIIVILLVAAVGFLFIFKGPGKATELVVIKPKLWEPCCCIKVDPSGVKRDHTALYWVRGAENCKCYPYLNWVPTELKMCPGAPRGYK